jgi:RNA recognition motif-containing protein
MAVDEVTSVYVGGLPYEANEHMLRDAFESYGTIVSVKVLPAPLLPPSLLSF